MTARPSIEGPPTGSMPVFSDANSPVQNSAGIPDLSCAPRIPEGLDGLFRCELYACTMLGKRCVQRQAERLKFGPLAGQLAPLNFASCASGSCKQGAEVLAALGIVVRPPPPPVRETKPCLHCGGPITKRPRQSRSTFAALKTCSARCSGMRGQLARQSKAQKAEG